MVPNSACRDKSPDPYGRLTPWFFVEKYSIEVTKNIPDGRKGALIYHRGGIVRFSTKTKWSRTIARWKFRSRSMKDFLKKLICWTSWLWKKSPKNHFLRNAQIAFGDLWYFVGYSAICTKAWNFTSNKRKQTNITAKYNKCFAPDLNLPKVHIYDTIKAQNFRAAMSQICRYINFKKVVTSRKICAIIFHRIFDCRKQSVPLRSSQRSPPVSRRSSCSSSRSWYCHTWRRDFWIPAFRYRYRGGQTPWYDMMWSSRPCFCVPECSYPHPHFISEDDDIFWLSFHLILPFRQPNILWSIIPQNFRLVHYFLCTAFMTKCFGNLVSLLYQREREKSNNKGLYNAICRVKPFEIFCCILW